jgi:glycosyltransferase involved in cell wall biosynthesis
MSHDGDPFRFVAHTMMVSVIVPAFNEERELGATLSSIRTAMGAFSDAGWDAELIVCDNNSSDRTSDVAREAGATVVFEPFNQISRARNTGAAAAQGDWLVFVDADSHPTSELFADMMAAIRHGRCLAGGSTVRFDGSTRVVTFVGECWNLVSRCARWAAGSFVFCEAAAFRDVGGFSLELFAGEEVDLFRRFKRLARRRGRTIEILTRHPLRTSDRKARLYTPAEGVRFALRTLLTGGRTLRSQKECVQWYDGRR